MDNLKISLANTVDKDIGNTGGAILERFTKSITSTIFDHPVYLLDYLRPSIAISVLHEESLNSAIWIWISNNFHMDATDQSGCTK